MKDKDKELSSKVLIERMTLKSAYLMVFSRQNDIGSGIELEP